MFLFRLQKIFYLLSLIKTTIYKHFFFIMYTLTLIIYIRGPYFVTSPRASKMSGPALLETKFLRSHKKMLEEDKGKTEQNAHIMDGRKLTLGRNRKNQELAL